MSSTAGTEAFLAALRAATAEPPAEAPPDTRVPEWTWHVITVLYEHLPVPLREDWARRAHGTLTARPASTGLRAVHTWHARTVLPLLTAARPDDTSETLTDLSTLHLDALRTPAAEATWRRALRPVLLRMYRAAYDHTAAYAEAHTNARAYAVTNGYSPADADAYGHQYAELSTAANADAFAEAHARAVGAGLAHAYATGRSEAYTGTYPGAQVRALVRAVTASTDAEETSAPPTRGPSAPVTLAEGLLDALSADRATTNR